MTDQMQTLRDDVAFLRGLAEQGRDAPLLGGAMLAWAGLIFGVASLVFYAELTRAIDPPGSGLVWLVAIVAYGVVGTLTVLRLRRRPGYQAPRNQASGAAWSAVGYAIFAIWAAFAVATYRTGEEVIMLMFAPVILALYGAGWSVAATVSPAPWLKLTAGAAFVSAAVMAWFTGEAEQFLIYAAALVLTALLPGLLLIRQARTSQIPAGQAPA